MISNFLLQYRLERKKTNLIRNATFILLILIGALLGLHLYAHHIVSQSFDRYQIRYDDIDLNLLLGCLEVNQIQFPDTFQCHTDNPLAKFRGKADQLAIHGFSYLSFIASDLISFDEITARKAYIDLKKCAAPKEDMDTKKQTRYCFNIDEVNIEESRFRIYEDSTDLYQEISLGGMEIDFKSFTNGAGKNKDSLELMIHELHADSCSYTHNKRIHTLDFPFISWKNNHISMADFNIQPLDKKKSKDALPPIKTSFYFSVPSLVIDAIDMKDLLYNKRIYCSSVTAEQPYLRVISNKNFPSGVQRRKDLPTKRILESSFNLTVDTVEISNGNVVYELYAKDRKTSGEIEWSAIDATVSNVTSDSSVVEIKQETRFQIHSSFMDSSKFDLYATFDLSSPVAAYAVEGELDNLPFTTINRMLEDVMMLSFEKGHMDQMQFKFKADDHQSNGQLNMYYRDLEVKQINEQYEESGNLLKWIATKFLVRKENKPGEEEKIGEINQERNKTSDIWDQLWSSVQDGMRGVMFPDFIDGD